MKFFKLISFLFLFIVLLNGCKEKNEGVEVLPNLYSVYPSGKDLDVPATPKENFESIARNDIIEVLKTVEEPETPFSYNIKCVLYINENGMIDKVSDSGTRVFHDSTAASRDSIYDKKIVSALALKMGDWKFNPALEKGKNVKSSMYFEFDVTKKSNENYDIKFVSFLNENRFIPVEKSPEIINRVNPEYPEKAKRNGVEGMVYVKLLVGTSGKVSFVTVIKSTNDIFNQPSIDAARKFTFKPAEKDGKPIAVHVVIPFKFKLKKADLMKYQDLEK